MDQKEYSINPKKFLENVEIFKKNDENNMVIKQHLDIFCLVNDLDKHDFVILGAACASYMQYLAITHFRDLDIYMLNKKAEKTARVDFIQYPLVPKDYADRLQEKDGYLFISDIDFLISVVCAVLWKGKIKNHHLIYSKLMIKELGLTMDELKSLMSKAINEMLFDHKKERLLERLPCLDEIYADIFEEENIESGE